MTLWGWGGVHVISLGHLFVVLVKISIFVYCVFTSKGIPLIHGWGDRLSIFDLIGLKLGGSSYSSYLEPKYEFFIILWRY
jgi:hypothetical protein